MVEATRLCKELGLQEVILEAEASQVVKTLQSRESDDDHFGSLIEDAKKILLQSGEIWQGRHIRREAKKVGHRLAKAAVKENSELLDIDSSVPCIQPLVN